jgi:hypothetical protein
MSIRIVIGTFSALLFCSLLSTPTVGRAETTISAPTQQDLFVSCLNEAEKVDGKSYAFQAPRRGHSAPSIPATVYQAKELCRQMRDSQEIAVENSSPKSSKTALAGDCTSYLNQYGAQHTSDGKHIQAMQNICQKMTGQRVVLNFDPSALNAIVPAAGDARKH